MEEKRKGLLPSLLPQVGMEFSTIDDAWMYWISYGGQNGFEVRKRYANKRKTDGKVRSCRFVCASEGHRKQDKRDHVTKCSRAETRTDCKVRMGLVMDREKENYKVSDLILEHNHSLHLPETSHLMVSQRKISELQGFEIETADDAGIGPKAAHELASLQVGGSLNLSYTYFRETVVFGAALLYDETFESFKWLFETFLKAHNGKHPKTIYTDQDAAMGKAVHEVFSETWHGLYTFHIMQNAVKHLAEPEKDESSTSSKDVVEGTEEESNILADFSVCMYEYEDEETFKNAFDIMRTKVKKQTWAECYMKDVFTLGMRSTQLSESLNSELKRHFKSDFDIIRFLKHFERVVESKRNKELNSEFESRKKLPRIKMRTPMLLQVSKLYTPIIFKAFQGEYERSMAACTTALEGNSEYLVSIYHEDFRYEKEYKVIGDPLQQTSTCSCGQFNRIGILCSHAIKVLDLMNIKSLPAQYVLKRWTKETRSGAVQDNQGRNIIENPRLDETLRYKSMTHKFLSLAQRAASHPGCSLIVHDTLDILSKKIEEEINGCTTPTVDQVTVSTNVTPLSNLVSTACLKKKDVETKTSKRKRTWLDKKRKFTKEGTKKKEKVSMKEQQTVKVAFDDGVAKEGMSEPYSAENVCPSTSCPKEGMSESYMTIHSYSQLLTGAMTGDLNVEF
ncbi:protein FAR1-RELATED SEQUENCE 5-like isoform X4 [Miscanthus floridulus]|uniref:protein FAR1-RELATED SEQUENCE 5-like isoform X4 n=1 Tax=Miscanthus floridulus TaxID=154761 RepID=UPI003459FB5D